MTTNADLRWYSYYNDILLPYWRGVDISSFTNTNEAPERLKSLISSAMSRDLRHDLVLLAVYKT